MAHIAESVPDLKLANMAQLGIPELLMQIGDEDLLIITADHGNDPTHMGTDHTREFITILLSNPRFREKGYSIGTRESFSDLASTIAENFAVDQPKHGKSFLSLL